ncbi:hypothetical protein HS041_25345 [Planomonospora sp. ID67723]|uniref:hypothetical protein n=1 Tax=Planomonospora sp. ID67723 TaxID=2738134 RepID=UPI0018C3EC1C|nr:hypothetical protein [Planomonospora sp. ID67723]MBG0831090.1 hypothetical protein [Planomonospora sp. ID67723]
MRFDSIPSMEVAPEGAAPSRVRTLIADLPVQRRTVMKGLAVSAMAAALVPLDWALSRRAARAAGPTSIWSESSCENSYSGGYGEGRNNWWGDGRAVCFGGWRMGSYPCNGSDRHFEGSRTHRPGASDQEKYTNVARTTTCSGKNAWKWRSGGRQYACSDAYTTVTWRDGTHYRGLTIAMCTL